LTGIEAEPRSICLTNPFAWPYVKRGTETLVRSLARWLQRSGRQVEIAAGGPATTSYDLDGVPVALFRARSARRVHVDLDEETTFIPAMARHLRRARPDVVHAFLFEDASAARLARRPYVVSYGGIALRASTAGHPLKRRLFAYGTRGARVVLCPSQAAATHLLDSYGYRAHVIPNGIDVTEFTVGADRDDVVLCPSTPDDDRKRVSVLVDAFAIAGRHSKTLELVLAGRASDGRRQSLLDRLPEELRTRVRFTGEVGAERLRELYGSAAVTCLPSLNEAFGMVLVESLASGTPVVGARHGAIPEIVDEEVGALFAPDDVEACSRALLTVVERARHRDLAARCRARAELYDWSVIGPRLLDVYKAACA
jgi:phosphatidylinositol alpha-mannosyltransferase